MSGEPTSSDGEQGVPEAGSQCVPVVRVFVSSPGDVSEERAVALTVIRHLQLRLQGRVVLVPILWEQEPLLATAGFQQEIDRRAPPSAADVALFILWARLGTPLSSEFVLKDGRRPTGTEWEYEDAVRASRERELPHILVYRKSAPPSVSVTDPELDRRRAEFEAVQAFFERHFQDETDLSFRGSFHAFADAAAFGERLETHLLKILTESLTGESASTVTWHGSPFRGLETFEAEHATVYFGRTRAVQEVRQALAAQWQAGRAFVLVVGSSGCGKSSLVRAGLVPLIAGPWVIEPELTGGLCRRAIFKPGDAATPLEALAAALLDSEALPDLATHGTASELAATFAESARAAESLVRGALRRTAATATEGDDVPARLVLVVDQIEELFTREGVTDEDRSAFAKVVAALARSGDAYVLATLRSDFYPAFTRLGPLMEAKEGAGHYDLGPPDTAELAQIIKGPAQVAGLSFETDAAKGISLDDELLAHASGHADALPLLEYALTLLEDGSRDRTLTFETYARFGGIQGAIRERADLEWNALPEVAQAAFPGVLRSLVEVAGPRGTRAARRRAPWAEATRGDGALELVERFVEARLFVAHGEGDDVTVEVAHEALLRTWERAARQIEAEAELLRIRGRLRSQSARWEATGRESSLLLAPGRPLEEARLLSDSAFEFTERERAFVEASEKRSRRMRALRAAGVAVIALLAVLATFFAFREEQQRRRAEENAEAALTSQHAEKAAREVAEDARDAEGEARKRAEASATTARAAEQKAQASLEEAVAAREEAEAARQEAETAREEAETAQEEAEGARAEAERARMEEQRAHYASVISLASQQMEDAQFDMAISTLEVAPASLRDWEWGHLWRRSHAAEITLLGHRGGVLAVAASPDGTYFATAGRDGAIRLWDGEDGSCRKTLASGRGAVWSLAFGADGSRLLSGGDDGRLRVWEVPSGSLLHEIEAHEGCVRAVAFDPSAERMISAGDDGVVRIWKGADQSLLATLAEHKDVVRDVAVSADGASLLSASQDGTLKWWDIEEATCTHTWEAHDAWVTGVAFLGTERFVTSSLDGTAKVWTRTETDPQKVFTGHEDAVLSVATDVASGLVATGGSDRTIRLWKPATDDVAQVHRGHSKKVVALSFMGRGRRLLSGSTDQSARVWSTRASRSEIPAHRKGEVPALAFAESGGVFASVGRDGCVRIWQRKDGGLVAQETLQHGESPTTAVAMSPDGSLVASGAQDGSVRVWRVSSRQAVSTFARGEVISALAFDGEGTRLLAASGDGTAGIWTSADGAELQTWEAGDPVSAAAWSPDETEVVTATVSGKIEVWDVQTGARRRALPGRPDAVWALRFTPDGAHLLVGGEDKTLCALEATTGRVLWESPAQPGPVKAIAVHPGGTRVAVASHSKTATIWDLQTGTHVLTLPEAASLVHAVAFDPSGRFLVSGRADGSLRLRGSAPWHERPASRRLEAPGWRAPPATRAAEPKPPPEAEKPEPASSGVRYGWRTVTCPWCGSVNHILIEPNKLYSLSCAFCGASFRL